MVMQRHKFKNADKISLRNERHFINANWSQRTMFEPEATGDQSAKRKSKLTKTGIWRDEDSYSL